MATQTQRTTAIGVFHDRTHAQSAVNELRRSGFREEDIGVAGREGETVSGASASISDRGSNVATATTTGVAAGAGVGALWGLGIMAGILPGIGPVIAGGTLAAIIASSATGAAVAGVAGALIGLGIPESEANHYETEFEAGHILVTVKASAGRYAEAIAIMNRAGASSHKFA